MRRAALSIGLLGVCWALGSSCAFDEREVQLVFSSQGAGGTLGAAENAPGGPGAPDESQPSVARLDVSATEIDLGPVAMNYPARARVTLINSGSLPLSAPAVGWDPSGAADFQLIQNQCSTDIAPGDRCDLRIQFVPSRAGALASTLHVESSVGTADVAFRGVGLEAGDLILSPATGSFEDFGGVLLGTTATSVFTLANPGAMASGPVNFTVNRPDFSVLPPSGAAGECGAMTSLVSPASCDIRVSFTGTERGPVEATLTAASQSAGAVSLTLLGRGEAPGQLVASTAALDFEGVVLEQAAMRSVTFENGGDRPLTLGGASLEPSDAEGFSIQNSDCGAGSALEAGQSCSVELAFRPPRASEMMMAELVVTANDGADRLSIALSGTGLVPGNLIIAALAAGQESFGPVLLGSSLEHVFSVANPGAQPSGVLGLAASAGFEVVPPAEGECVPGETSLVDGQSCNVRVRFSPTERAVTSGTLTISSPLAGTNSLVLSGQGILAATLEVPTELSFGRVLTNLPAQRTITVRNAGDQPLPAPLVAITSNSAGQAAAFAYTSQCGAPLAFGEECSIDVTFAPGQATPHSASLELTSNPGGSASVLLLGEAIAPGSLVLAAAAGGSTDFGDVPVATSRAQSFTLTNPGNVASGRITISTDNNRFEPLIGDCDQATDGLVDGSSCTFSVSFTPVDATQAVANLSIVSAGAGRAGLELRGRGRRPATLTATGNRDLGRANIGQDALTQPANEFTWTVNNEGDLASQALTVVNDNRIEFEVRNDSCSNAQVAGRASCQMTIRFRPSQAGARSGRITITESGRNLTLALTGLGVRLAALGQSCVNATCGAGVCTGGVCCDRECSGSCQQCSTAGVCSDLSNREQCGNGSGRCFGVNRCLLPEGLACGTGAECGSGNCERRLNGNGQNDRSCCATDCDATGQQCNAQGQCQSPALMEGALCGRAGDPACASGLQCKGCLDGAQRCTPPAACCGGCGDYDCVNGACGCAPINGGPALDCGDGLCIQQRTNACCPDGPPRCSGALPNCDPSDHLCKQCVDNGDCTGGAVCQGGTCGCGAGTKRCNDGRCIANAACCDTCAGGSTCQGGSCQCAGGQPLCNGSCPNLQTDANNCGRCGHDCLDGRCAGGVCQPFELASGFSLVGGLAVNATHVYWVDGVNSTDYALRRIDKAGAGAIQNVATGRAPLSSVVVNSTQAFTMEGRSVNGVTQRVIVRVPLEGGTVRDLTTTDTFAAGAAVGASGNNLYWLGFDNVGAQFARSPASTGAAFPPTPTLFGLVSANAFNGWSFSNNCLIYKPFPNGPEIHRRCETDTASVLLYDVPDGSSPFFDRSSTDGTFAYFFEQRNGSTTFDLKRIRLSGADAGTAATVTSSTGNVIAPTADNDSLYFFHNTDVGAFDCSAGWTIFKGGKAPNSAATSFVSAAQTCPTFLISDGSVVYWAVTDASSSIGSIMAVAK